QTGWLALLLAVPCLNIALFVYLLAMPGRDAAAAPAAAGGLSTAVVVAVIAAVVLAVPIIGIVAAIAIPGLLRARVSANEASAIGDLRTVVVAQNSFQSANRGFYAGRGECLSQPARCLPAYSGPAFLDAGTLVSPRNGYVRDLRPG